MSVLTDSVKGWLNAGLGLIYPEVCQLCGEARATPAEGYVCGGCRARAYEATGDYLAEEPFCIYEPRVKT